MSGNNNQFDGIGGSIRSLLIRLGFPVALDQRADDLLEIPEHSEIEFAPISPSDDALDSIRSFSELSAAWIRRNCDSFTFERAIQLAAGTQVAFVSGTTTQLTGEVTDIRQTHAVTAAITSGTVYSSCDCDQARKPSALPGYLPCEHVAALMLDVVAEKRIPLSAAAEIVTVCPITRQPLAGLRMIYRCTRCGLNISPDGWDFLHSMDKGKCCGCGAKGTIIPRPAGPGG